MGLLFSLLTITSFAAEKPDADFAAYAGSASCRDCHRADYDLWSQSHHALAERSLQTVTDQPAFVLSRDFKHGNETTTFQSANRDEFTRSAGCPKIELSCPKAALKGVSTLLYNIHSIFNTVF
jgi:hypothetical protein